MGPLLIRRRSDGLMQIRRARARDLVLTTDAAVLLTMLAGWVLLTVFLVLTLLFDPPFLVVPAWLILALAVEQRQARRPHLVEAHLTPPPGSAA